MKKHTDFFKSFFAFLFFMFLSGCSNQSTRDLYPEEIKGGFELLTANQTGIDFNNRIIESESLNHYFFGHVYIGSGVAIGDINNDGLPDVFFAGSQVSDRLYLNQGDFKFTDITKDSNIGSSPGWTWGVTMADVNADGYLDIYVSRNGKSLDLKKRQNKLYINNKDLTFTESASLYGLDDVGFSTQAVFFDMDNDGDLDMYQVNQPADKKVLLINKITQEDLLTFKDRLYRNDNGKFKDISLESGISKTYAYGLSVNASDFNGDGFIDLYVANDYAEPDFMYYNNGDGTFTNVIDKELKHITQLSMGSDAGDINNDGLIDLMTTDMTPEDHYRSKTNMASMSTERFYRIVDAGGHHQYMTNTLQINTGVEGFYDVANIAGVTSTDWSWSSLMVDLNNDGLKDIAVTNGIKKDVDNNDYRVLLKNIDKVLTEKEILEMSRNAPSNKISNYLYKNKGGFKFEKVADKWGFNTPSFSHGMAYGDLDNDGDLDVVINNMEDHAFVYKNNTNGNFLKLKLKGDSKNPFGIGAKATIYHNGKIQVAENILSRGFVSSMEPLLFFGLGKDTKVDKIELLWPDGKTSLLTNIDANETLVINHKKAKNLKKDKKKSKTIFKKINSQQIGLDFKHKENEFNDFKEEVLLPHRLSTEGPFSVVADVNGDNLEDVFVGGAAGQSAILFLQNVNGSFKRNQSQPWERQKTSEDLEAVFFDADQDGDQDLYVTSGGSEFKRGNKLFKDRLYLNDGKGTFKNDKTAIPNIYESTKSVKISDIDRDGDLDLFVGTRLIPGKYTHPATSYFLINNNGKFSKAPNSVAPILEKIGMVSDAVFSDIDKDGDEDLLVVGEWMKILLLENQNGVFIDGSKKLGLDNVNTRGIWWSITANDIDKDGDDDYIVGNLGINNKFKASKERPFKVYTNDFDNNGTNDVVLAKYYKEDYVPLRGRECTSQQMPYVAKKFKDFHSFASSKLIDILPDDKIDEAIVYQIESFESILLINENGKLKIKPLPIEVQTSPIKNSIVDDFNNDGHRDILIVGNHYGVEVETTRYDAGFGNLLLGDGSNNFTPLTPELSGVFVPYDSRSINPINIKDKKALIITNNDDKLTLLVKLE